MINEKLRNQLFSQRNSQTIINNNIKDQDQFNRIENTLENITLPETKFNNISEHFKEIVTSQVKDYLKIVQEFKSIPQIPEQFCFRPGWTK